MPLVRLSDADKAKALQNYDELEKRKRKSRSVVGDFVNDTKSTLLFQYNGEDFVAAAPLAINLIGSYFIACSHFRTIEFKLKPPLSGEFKHLSTNSLRTSLAECGHRGLNAFRNMAPRMNTITVISQDMNQDVKNVLECLEGGPRAGASLKLLLRGMLRRALECSQQASEVDKSFSGWLSYLEEFHGACLASETSVDIQRFANQTQLIARQAQQIENKNAHEVVDTLKNLSESLEVAREAYKISSDEFPKGWELVGQQFVAGFSQTVNNALNTAITALVAKLNPVTQVGEAVNIFSGKSGSGGSSKPKVDVAAQGTVQQQPFVLPPDYNDPAYTAVTTVADVATLLLSILTSGKDGGVDWDAALPKPKETNHGAGFVLSMLEFAQKQFKPTAGPPSQKLATALGNIVKVAKDFKAAADNKAKMGSKETDAATIEQWQKTVIESVNEFAVLQATANSISKTTPQMLHPVKITQASQASGSIATSILEKASERAVIAQKTSNSTVETYHKASQTYTGIGKILAEIAAELAKLGETKIGFTDVKAILTKCIETVVHLKAQIRKLVAYFTALAEMITYIEGNELQRFIDYGNGTTEDDKRSINGFTTLDFTRQIIFNSTMLIRAHFSLIADIAQMWDGTNARYLLQGTTLVEKLARQLEYGSDDDEELDDRISQLKDWTGKANDGIFAIAVEKQLEVFEGMKERAINAARDAKQLPPLSEQTQKAIEAGSDVVQKAAMEGLENFKPPVTARTFSSTLNLYR